MMTTATQNELYNAHEPELLMAFELREKTWQLGFSLGHGQPPRERTMAARDTQRLLNEVAQAKVRSLNLSAFVDGCSCSMKTGLRRSHTRRFPRHGLDNDAA